MSRRGDDLQRHDLHGVRDDERAVLRGYRDGVRRTQLLRPRHVALHFGRERLQRSRDRLRRRDRHDRWDLRRLRVARPAVLRDGQVCGRRRDLQRGDGPLRLNRKLGPGATLALALAWAAPAHADEAPAARADRLFREGRAALEASRYDEACPKLAESQQLDPGTGTLLALALCHEGSGATASAALELTKVIEASQRRPDRAALARHHLKAVEQRLSKITLALADPTAKGTVQLRVDGSEFAVTRLETPVPFDPGDHVVEASMPGMTPWKSTVQLGKDGDVKVVIVPKLEPPPVAAVVAPVVEAPAVVAKPEPSNGGRTLAWVVGGSGVAVAAVGGIFGGLALSAHSSAKSLCPASPCSSSQGVSDNNSAKTDAWVADVMIPAGVVGVGVATYLFFTSRGGPSPATTAVQIGPDVRPGIAGLALSGRW